jgi:hypothetical protein
MTKNEKALIKALREAITRIEDLDRGWHHANNPTYIDYEMSSNRLKQLERFYKLIAKVEGHHG